VTPKRRGDMSVALSYVVRLGDNRANAAKINAALRAAGKLGLVQGGAFVLGATRIGIPFARQRVITVRVASGLRPVMKSLARARLRTLALRLQISVRRRGDRKTSTGSERVTLTLPRT
jgi:hypothetical protein